jgi:hypothetical protein
VDFFTRAVEIFKVSFLFFLLFWLLGRSRGSPVGCDGILREIGDENANECGIDLGYIQGTRSSRNHALVRADLRCG